MLKRRILAAVLIFFKFFSLKLGIFITLLHAGDTARIFKTCPTGPVRRVVSLESTVLSFETLNDSEELEKSQYHAMDAGLQSHATI
jgi:hypothetical protein